MCLQFKRIPPAASVQTIIQVRTWGSNKASLGKDTARRLSLTQQQILEALANRLSKHRKRCIFFSFLKTACVYSLFTIRYAGEFVQKFAESHILIFLVSTVLPRLHSRRTFRWLPESPENNYHQHPTYRPRTRKPPHGLCGGTPDPNYATRLPYWFSMSFFLTGFGARLAFQRGFLNIEKSTFALGSMEELYIICHLGDNFYAFRVSHYTWTHPSPKNAVLKETVSCATPYNQRKPPTPRTPQLALHMRVKGSVPRRPGRFIHAQLQNQKSRGPGYQISYPGFKHEKEKKGWKARDQWQAHLNDFNADIS